MYFISLVLNKFIKFVPNKDLNKNKSKRAEILKDLIPSGFASTDNFISYDWESGDTLYQYDSSYIYNKFLEKLRSNIIRSEKYGGDRELFDNFYGNKTRERLMAFLDRFGLEYFNQEYK